MRVGFTSGCFDLIHYGHLQYLRQCRNRCDFLLVGVDSDEMVRAAKGAARPIIPEQDRLQMIASLKPVDSAVLLRSLDYMEEVAQTAGVTHVFRNESFLGREIRGLTPSMTLEIIPDVPGLLSTTEIIRQIQTKTTPRS